MAITKIACPNCGEEAIATVNSREDNFRKISSKPSPAGVSRSNNFETSCANCGEKIYYWLE